MHPSQNELGWLASTDRIDERQWRPGRKGQAAVRALRRHPAAACKQRRKNRSAQSPAAPATHARRVARAARDAGGGGRRAVPLVAVVLRLVRAIDRDAEVVRLLRSQDGQIDPEGSQMQTRDLFVQLLREPCDRAAVCLGVAVQFDLGHT